jgi:hypothetical protein
LLYLLEELQGLLLPLLLAVQLEGLLLLLGVPFLLGLLGSLLLL